VISARYSSAPPTIAPRRFAPNATVDALVFANRCAKTRLARKIGANASATAARNRGTTGSDSSADCGITQARTSAASNPR